MAPKIRDFAIPLLFVLGGLHTGAGAQEVVAVGERPACPGCTAELRPVVRLGGVEDPAGVTHLAQVAANSRGQYVVSSPTFLGELFVYGSDGAFLRSVGRRGEGPGEFRRPQLLAFGAGDSLHAVEAGGIRYTLLDPDLTPVRSANLQGRVSAFRVRGDGSLLAASPAVSADGAGHALQLFGGDGRVLHAFDPMDPEAGGRAALGRNLTLDARGHGWSVEAARYRLKEWDGEGRLVRVLEANRDWIPRALPERLDPTRERPPGQIGGLEVDEEGLLWLFAIVPDGAWRPGEAGAPPDPNRIYDTVFEVIDPGTGKLLARGRSDRLVLPFQRGMAYSTVEEPSGDLRIEIWRMVVTGR